MNWFTTNDLLGRDGPFTLAVDYFIWYAVVAVLVCLGIYFLNKYKTEKRVKIVLIVLWAIAVALDVVKLIVNIATGLNIHSDLPLYVCSLFLYVMPFAIWGKGKVKMMALAYICTIGLFGAIGNYVVPSVVVSYSLLSFHGFHTSLYHTILWATPLVILCTGSFKFKFKDFGWQFLGFVVITVLVIPFNYITDSNYMYFSTGVFGFEEPFIEMVSYAWPIFLYIAYAAIMMVMELLAMGITKLVEIIAQKVKKDSKETIQATAGVSAEAKQNESQKTQKKRLNKNE